MSKQKFNHNWAQEIVEEGLKILNSLSFDHTIVPRKQDVLNFLTINPQKIKVVILGQDPYPTPGVANGFAFAVNSHAPIPQSLKNIFSEIKEVRGHVVADRTLNHWIKQGVLLLNTSLTTIVNKPNAHQQIWKTFTTKVIEWLDQNFKVIWVLWGNEAKKYIPILHNKFIYDAHPSPLSVHYRQKNTFKDLQAIINISW